MAYSKELPKTVCIGPMIFLAGLDLPWFRICHIRHLPYFVNSHAMGDPEYGRSGTMEDAERRGALDCEHSFDLMSDSLPYLRHLE